ncbi:MAG: phytanoyl-CoA dioxygenase family protein [Anaerolineaceae bacterium]|nr:phytanoyl-CoA dioxygenase family protein [Anaerolineaceae bacterium]
MRVRFGPRDLEFPCENLGLMRASRPDDPVELLRDRMENDGYLWLRDILPRSDVLAARQVILEHMAAREVLSPGEPVMEGVMPRGGRGLPMNGRSGIAHRPVVLKVMEHEALYSFFETWYGEAALTFHFKWLRAVGNEAYTGAHMDYVYMGRGSPRLQTVWIPMGDIPVGQGTLAVCAGSHRTEGFARIRDTYGRMDVDRDGVEGWFSRDPLELSSRHGGSWRSTDFRAGDVVTFGMHLMHASTTNLTQRFRLSCDVRFQPASDPVDPRWVRDGEGHVDGPPRKTMAQARNEWRV